MSAIELNYRGQLARVEKRVVHQWRTDIVLTLDERRYTIGRLESAMTRREVKELALRWLKNRERQ